MINIGMCIEIAINLIQQVMFIGFLYLFFDKGENKVKNILAFTISVFILFTMANYYTFRGLIFNHSDALITTAVMLIYTIFFLKGGLYLRIIVPIIAFGLNTLVANLNLAVMVRFGNRPFVEALTFSTSFRYMYIIISNLIYAVLLLVLLRIGKKKIKISSIPEILSFLLIAVIICVASLSDMILYEVSDFNKEIFPYVVLISVSIFALAGMFWYLLLKISRDNKLKTDLLLSKQREELYKNSVLSTNEHIEKLAKIKHDTKNKTMAISNLIANGEYERAIALSDSISESFTAPSLCHSSNPVLNAILNVEIQKASRSSVRLHYVIDDALSFVEDADIISIIGNMCDNAIEYLSKIEEDKRDIHLNISAYKDYHYIVCKNTIISPVLKVNPDMHSTKEDSILHGKGMSILREVAKKYNGELSLKEVENEFSASIIVRNQN